MSETRTGIMMVAGEASGDVHGAAAVQAMRRKHPGLSFFGMGGPAMKAAGVDIHIECGTLSVVGITEVVSKIPRLFRAMRAARRLLREMRPSLLIVIDFPDFNIHLAGYAKRLNIPVLYYVSPQIWAWRQGRVKTLRRVVDHMAVILPFEASFYRRHGVPATFVGHPLLDSTPPVIQDTASDNFRYIGLLPGSRDREIIRHLPVMVKTAQILHRRHPGIGFLLSVAPSIETGFIMEHLNGVDRDLPIELVFGGARHVLHRSWMVLAVSGTVTLEAALCGIPMVIFYKLSPVSCYLGKKLVKVDYFSLVNLIAQRRLVPEFLQDDAGPENLANAMEDLMIDPGAYARRRHELLRLRKRLGGPGAAVRVAEIAMKLIEP